MSVGAVLLLAGCGLTGEGDDNRQDCQAIFDTGYRSEDEQDYFIRNCYEEVFWHEGEVSVGLTDNVPASGTYVLQDIYNPGVRSIIAVVQIENASVGMEVEGRWYQMGLIQQRAPNITAGGALISQAGFPVETVNAENRAQGRLTLNPNARLPEDSYELRVYIDGKLAKTVPFVVSNLVPGPSGPVGSPPQSPAASPTPAR
jgi:hypothetical protein